MKFEIWKSYDGQWYARIRARNGNILMTSEGYNRKAGALKSVRRIVASAATAPIIIRGEMD